MKQFIAFVKKEFYHIFRDKRTMLILFGLPIAQILIFGYVVNNEINNARIVVFDPSRDQATREITNKVIASGYFELAEMVETASGLEKSFQKGDIKAALIFEPQFSEKLARENIAHVQVIADASDPNTANLMASYIQAIINTYTAELNAQSAKNATIITETKMLFNPELKSAYMFVPGTMALILMLLSAMMTSISIAREKEMGTMEVLLVSPLKPIQIIIGKVMPYMALSFINACVIMVLGTFIFNVPIRGSIVLLMSESLLFILLALSLGILISTVAKTQEIAMFISMLALMLPTMLLSGFIYPIENMPGWLQVISNIMPARWFIVIIKNIMIKGSGLGHIWIETLIMTGMIAAFLLLSIRKFKIRLE